MRIQDGRCLAEVKDSGVGLSGGFSGGALDGQSASKGLGTGLANLRERMQLVFGDEAQLSLTALDPHGFCVTISIPAPTGPAKTAVSAGE